MTSDPEHLGDDEYVLCWKELLLDASDDELNEHDEGRSGVDTPETHFPVSLLLFRVKNGSEVHLDSWHKVEKEEGLFGENGDDGKDIVESDSRPSL